MCGPPETSKCIWYFIWYDLWVENIANAARLVRVYRTHLCESAAEKSRIFQRSASTIQLVKLTAVVLPVVTEKYFHFVCRRCVNLLRTAAVVF